MREYTSQPVWLVVHMSTANGLCESGVYRAKSQAYAIALCCWLRDGQEWGPLRKVLIADDRSGDSADWIWDEHTITVGRTDLWE